MRCQKLLLSIVRGFFLVIRNKNSTSQTVSIFIPNLQIRKLRIRKFKVRIGDWPLDVLGVS